MTALSSSVLGICYVDCDVGKGSCVEVGIFESQKEAERGWLSIFGLQLLSPRKVAQMLEWIETKQSGWSWFGLKVIEGNLCGEG